MPSSPKYIKIALIILAIILMIVFRATSSDFSFVFKSQNLSKIVQDNLGSSEKYAIYIEDLADGESYSLHALDSFPAASLYKVYLLAATLKEVEEGSLKLEDNLKAEKQHLIEVFQGVDFGYEDAPEQIEYSVEETMQRVGRISDNFASIMLAEKISWEKIQDISYLLGARNTIIKDPITTSAADIGLFFKKLYLSQVVSDKVSNKIMELLLLSKINDRIPAGVPDGVKIVHKTGELSRVRHDGGIVYLPNGRAYVIVLMSKDLQFEDEGVETLAKISKDVYEYFKNKSK
ncbi:serine hydrolase [Candidatus Daviesbacteria bacterium]|nr:serine hydrolase [Candidatus Daviesbacteria bacterium]